MDGAYQAVLQIIDRLTIAYLSYRSGKLQVSNEQAKQLQDFANLVIKLHNDVDTNKDNIKDKIDARYN